MEKIELRCPAIAQDFYEIMKTDRPPEETERLLLARAARAEKEGEIVAAIIAGAKSFGWAILVLGLLLFSFAGGGADQPRDIKEIVRPATPKPPAPRITPHQDTVIELM